MRLSTFSSNSVRLSWKDWAGVGGALVVLFAAFPPVWGWLEGFEPGDDYRFPYEISSDYWMYRRWCRRAASEYPYLVLGDSVMWGQYVARGETLPHCLNERMGEEAFANLSLDGIHPAAMAGLVRHYGKDIRKKKVVVNLNFLWMSSLKHDLQGDEEFRFNHPRLVPQLVPDLACYNPGFSEVMGVVLDRYVSFFSCMNHIGTTYLENMTVDGWTVETPYANPVGAVGAGVPEATAGPKSRPVNWRKRGIAQRNFEWVPLERSFQWRSFKRVLGMLRARKNDVFVLFISINPYMQTKESLARYDGLKERGEAWLRQQGVAHYSVLDLPSEQYADASHPLKDGYEEIARDLLNDGGFQEWMRR